MTGLVDTAKGCGVELCADNLGGMFGFSLPTNCRRTMARSY